MERKDYLIDYLLPKKIVCAENVLNSELLLQEKSVQIGLSEPLYTIFKKGAYAVFDFGKEIAGGIRFLMWHCPADTRIRFRAGESVAEVMADLGEHNSGNDHALRDLTIPVSFLSDNELFSTGFRFLRIDIVEASADVFFKSVYAKFERRDLRRVGNFECSDSLMNKIYDTACYTIELCMRDYIWDGIKRDRLVWIGDMYPEMRAVCSIFGQDKSVERSLDFVRDQTPLPGWMNAMPSYSLWWIIILHDYYLNTGNMTYLETQKAYLSPLMRQIAESVNEQGKIILSAYFLDWSIYEHEDAYAGVHFLAVTALKKGSGLLTLLREDTGLIGSALVRLLQYEPVIGEKKQSVSVKHFSGEPLSVRDKAMIAQGGAENISTFLSYFIFSGLFETAGADYCYSVVNQYYGAMLDMGATTFWEDFNIKWIEGDVTRIDELPDGRKNIHRDFGAECYKELRHSLCHGWSAGIVPFFTEAVLGIRILEPGCKKISITPRLGHLTYARGEFPTPYGTIRLDIKKDKTGKLTVKHKIPKEISFVLNID